MAATSRRLLQLLSLLSTGRVWPLVRLSSELRASPRTVRRDVESLRHLGYAVDASPGPGGGYRLGPGLELPPLLLDDAQALAVALALQTAPTTMFGLGEDAARALVSLRQVMPRPLRAAMEALPVTPLRNYWEFAAPPIAPAALTAVGRAVQQRELLSYDLSRDDGSRPEPAEPDFVPPRTIEPHQLVVWAGRWYLVGFQLDEAAWRVLRVDRLVPRTPTGRRFVGRDRPGPDLASFVMSSYDRGDTPPQWQCLGTVRMALPADVVARWAPAGSVVEHLDAGHARLTLGAWSWAGIAGLVATFDADIDQVEPPELVQACGRIAARLQSADAMPTRVASG